MTECGYIALLTEAHKLPSETVVGVQIYVAFQLKLCSGSTGLSSELDPMRKESVRLRGRHFLTGKKIQKSRNVIKRIYLMLVDILASR